METKLKRNASAGILLYRHHDDRLEVLLAHPGGPYWSRQDHGSWSVPKGLAESDEAPAAVAAREFAEETGFELAAVAADPSRSPLDLGEVALKSGKLIHAWAVEGDLDPDLAHSNEFEIEWPPRSGRRQMIRRSTGSRGSTQTRRGSGPIRRRRRSSIGSRRRSARD